MQGRIIGIGYSYFFRLKIDNTPPAGNLPGR
jgi:hypothetical protein